MIRVRVLVAVGCLAFVLSGCGGDNKPPTQPSPPPPPVNNDPPANTRPVIDSITVQGRRPNQPSRFADVREMIDVSATVRDPETPVEELTYQWTATAGTFITTGRVALWTAPDSIPAPTVVTITLKVTEHYGHPGQAKIFSQDTTSTVTVNVHDSVKEVGDMSVRFLTEFSKPQTNKDWRDIMRDFKAQACPDPGEFDSERQDVERHYNEYFMHSYRVDAANTALNFGGQCTVPGRAALRSDACAFVPVRWDSTHLIDGKRSLTIGVDYLSAAYSVSDGRWYLCASQFIPTTTGSDAFYSR